MGLIVNFNEGWDPKTKSNIEREIRQCISDPPIDEEWVVSVIAGFSQNYCDVRVTTPNQTRTRLFFEEAPKLAKAITDWINMYPLR